MLSTRNMIEPGGDLSSTPLAASWVEPPGMGKTLLVGVSIGVFVAFIGVAGAMLASGQGVGASIGLGAFVAAWGGFGFGMMIGGVVWATRIEEANGRNRTKDAQPEPSRVGHDQHLGDAQLTVARTAQAVGDAR